MLEEPEQLLAGADRPRPLPPLLRARLEGTLAAHAEEVGARRPLSPEVRGRLEGRLQRREAARAEHRRTGGPVTGGPVTGGLVKRARKGWPVLVAMGTAAALALVLGLGIPGLVHPSRPGTLASGAHSPMANRAAARMAGDTTAAPKSEPLPTSRGGARSGHGVARPRDKAGGPLGFSSTRAVPLPVVSAVVPKFGPAAGGNTIVLRGRALMPARAVYFGPARAVRFRVVSGRELKVVPPAHAPGPVDIVVVTAHGHSSLNVTDRYTYQAQHGAP